MSQLLTLSGSMNKAMTTFSIPRMLLIAARGALRLVVRNRSSLFARMLAASSMAWMRGFCMNSSGDMKSAGTSMSSMSLMYGDDPIVGWDSLTSPLSTPPKATESLVMLNGILTVPNPHSSAAWSARVAILPASECASGQAAPQASICGTVPVWVNIAGGWVSPWPSSTSIISSLMVMRRNPHLG